MLMAKKKRPTTDNRGAADERACILAHISRIRRTGEYGSGYDTLIKLHEWLESRSKRFKARKGGL